MTHFVRWGRFGCQTHSQNMQLLPTDEEKMICDLPGGSIDQRFCFLPNDFGLCYVLPCI